ncbi:macro domain-containing protein [Bacillus toyonensis]|uniref:macro domain-containing protein n=1 Tax=Bacillus toyonensis TaxID=155322 RepID=UPI00028B5E07|nr:macro domain-containing protein [Bacillus toyonensis]AFU16630.1 gifsy-1 prophage protein [Bacillus thuringiensis MC28]MED3542018.1 macro domain-containing protein [Bacillus toyonensis]MEE2021254.1 macro domain-containing protein [Bacillus toyonensis]
MFNPFNKSLDLYTPDVAKEKKIVLLAVTREMYNAFRDRFDKWGNKNVVVYYGRFEELGRIDCLVSPANSFGLMDGGMDKLIIDYFGKDLENRVQQHIIDNFMGEQPVGTSFTIETNHNIIPYLAHTPTMRLPRDISSTMNVFFAMKAMLNAIGTNPNIKTIAVPALGAGTGNVSPSEVARQMEKAYEYFMLRPKKIDVQFVYERTVISEGYNGFSKHTAGGGSIISTKSNDDGKVF